MFLRRVAVPLMMMAKVKETTGIVQQNIEKVVDQGVQQNPQVPITMYNKSLETKAVPEDKGYRKSVESFTRYRLKVCPEEDYWEANEEKDGCGQDQPDVYVFTIGIHKVIVYGVGGAGVAAAFAFAIAACVAGGAVAAALVVSAAALVVAAVVRAVVAAVVTALFRK